MARLMILGGGGMQMPAIRSAKGRGHQILVMDPDPEAPGFALADRSGVADLADEETCFEAAHQFRPEGVMTFAADYPMRMVGQLCHHLGLPGPRPEAVAATTDKLPMRQRLREAGIAVPAFHEVLSDEDAVRAISALNGPSIVKPTRSSGSRGITRLPSAVPREQVERAIRFARNVQGPEAAVLVEECVDGDEFSIEAITWGGRTEVLALTEKTTTGAPHFVEVAHRQPGDARRWVELESVVRGCVEALGIDDSPTHTEVRLTERGPVVIEIGSRCGGGYISSHLVPLSTGIDFIGAAIDVVLGSEPRIESTQSRGAAIEFVRAEPGHVLSHGALDEIRGRPGVIELQLQVTVGDRVPPLRDARDRIGFVICASETAESAAEECRRCLQDLNLRTAEAPPDTKEMTK